MYISATVINTWVAPSAQQAVHHMNIMLKTVDARGYRAASFQGVFLYDHHIYFYAQVQRHLTLQTKPKGQHSAQHLI